MMKYLLLFLLLLITSPAHAIGLEGLLEVWDTGYFNADSINGITAINETGPTDTGQGFGTLAAGTISVAAATDSTGGTASVYLEVDGAVQDSITGSAGRNLTYIVSSGAHSVRVYGVRTGSASFDAGPFSLPMP